MNYLLKNILFFSVGSIVYKTLSNDKTTDKKNTHNIPDFKGVIEVKHAIPGRIRFFIPLLKYNKEAEAVLMQELKKISSLTNIEINILTGSLTINYKDNRIQPQLLIAIIIKLLGLEDSILKKPTPMLGNEMKMVKDSINMAIYNKSGGILDGSSLLVLTLLIAAAYKAYTGSGIKVGPTTCLMWALSYLD